MKPRFPKFPLQTTAWVFYLIFVIPAFLVTIPAFAQSPVISADGTRLETGTEWSFGTVDTGRKTDVTFMIENQDTAELVLETPLMVSGPDAGEFEIFQQPQDTVREGKSTHFKVRFSPSSAGEKNAVIEITHNGTAENPYSLALTGNGKTEMFILSGTVTDGDNPISGVSLRFSHDGQMITTDGNGFYQCQIPAGISTEIRPEKENYEAWVPGFIALNNVQSDQTHLDFHGTLHTDPEMAVRHEGTDLADGTAVDFGSVELGTTADIRLTLANTGTGDLIIRIPLSLAGPDIQDFEISGQPSSVVTPGSETTLTIRFVPGKEAERTASIQITNNDPDEAGFVIMLTGTGTRPAAPEIQILREKTVQVSGKITDFGKIHVGADTVLTWMIENTGDRELNLGLPFVITGDHVENFSVVLQPSETVFPGSSTSFQIRFIPSTEGDKTGLLSIGNSDSDENPYVITLQGTALSIVPPASPELFIMLDGAEVLHQATCSLGSVDAGTSLERTFVIENRGTADLTFKTPFLVEGGHAQSFSVVSQPDAMVIPGGSTSFTLRFLPFITDLQTASIQIGHNDEDRNPFKLLIEGTGNHLGPPFKSSAFHGFDGMGRIVTLGTASNPFEYTVTINTGSVIQSAGYNRTDGMIYGTEPGSSRIVRINGEGKITRLSIVVPFESTAGDCDNDGNYVCVSTKGNQLLRLHTGSGKLDVKDLSSTFPACDMAYISGRFCGISGNVLYMLTPGSGQVNTLPITGTLASESHLNGNVWDAVWTAEDGYLYALSRSSNRIVKVNTANGLSFYSGTGSDTKILDGFSSHDVSSPMPRNGLVNGYIWQDTDRDGIQDTDETGIAGVTVELIRNSSRIQTVTTDTAGQFRFADINPEQYSLVFENLMEGFTFSPQNSTDDAHDSDADPVTGRTAPFIIDAYSENTKDAGLMPPQAKPDITMLLNGQSLVSGSMIDFGFIGSAEDSSMSLSLMNEGKGNLLIAQRLAVCGTDSSDFTITQPASALQPNEKSDFIIRFSPATDGVKTAFLAVHSNDPDENPYLLYMKGSALRSVTVSGTVTDGTLPMPDALVMFSHDGHTETTDMYGKYAYGVPLNTSTIISISKQGYEAWTPSSVSLKNIITNQNSIDFSGSPVRLPEIELRHQDNSLISGSVYDFFGCDFYSTHESVFTLHNLGEGLLIIKSPVVLSGPDTSDFKITSGSVQEIVSNGSVPLAVSFSPSSEGLKTAVITIRSNDGDEDPYTIMLHGTGIPSSPPPSPELRISRNGIPIGLNGSVEFGAITTGTDSTVVFILENHGNADLILTAPIQISGASADFSIEAQPQDSIPAEGKTEFRVRFVPLIEGPKTAVLTISTNDPQESTFLIHMSGTGISVIPEVPEIEVLCEDTPLLSGSTVDFGTHVMDTDTVIVLTIHNHGTGTLSLAGPQSLTGTDAGYFEIAQPADRVIGSGKSSDLAIRFNAVSAGVKTATLAIASDDADENPYLLNLKAQAEAIPAIGIAQKGSNLQSGKPFEMGSVKMGADTTFEFSVDNTTGSDYLLTLPLTVTGDNAVDFKIMSQPKPRVPAGDSTVFSVGFFPTSGGEKTAQILIRMRILSSAAENRPSGKPGSISVSSSGSYTLSDISSSFLLDLQATAIHDPEIYVSGNSIEIVNGDPTPSVTDGTDFGNADIIFSTVSHNFSITNQGTTDLGLTGTPKVVISGTNAADFTVTLQPSSPIAPGSIVNFTIEFNPSASGLRSALVTIANDDADENPYTFAIQGTGTTSPEIDIKGNGISIANGDNTPSPDDDTYFGNVNTVGATSVKTFSIDNLGSENLILTGSPRVTITGTHAAEFTVTVQPSTPVSAGGSTTFTISFDPAAIGSRDAAVSITSNDSNENPYLFAIRGNGIGPGAPFPCVPNFYHIYTTGGIISYLDASVNPYQYTTIATAGAHINGVGYNTEDGLLYGYNYTLNRIIRIDAAGNIITMPSVPPYTTYAGDFDLNGNLYFLNQAGSRIAVYDISTGTISDNAVTGTNFLGYDMAYMYSTGRFYGMRNTTLYIFNPATRAVTTLAVTGNLTNDYNAGINDGTWGAAWTTVDGQFFTADNTSGRFYKVNVSTGTSVYIGLGQIDVTYNDGASCPLASSPLPTTGLLAGRAWLDYDGDGIQDSGEGTMPLINVTLRETGSNTLIGTAVTALDGTYMFQNLAPSQYYLTFSNLPTNFGFSPQDQGGNDVLDSDVNQTTSRTIDITLSAGEIQDFWDAGVRTTGLGDWVWEDTDHDGRQDAGETAGVQGVVVKLYRTSNNNLIATTYTDQYGRYYFGGLSNNVQYYVDFNDALPGGYTMSPRDQGSNDALDSDPRTAAGGHGIGTTGDYTMNTNRFNATVDMGIYQATFPEIDVQGNGASIPDGDVTPSLIDHTDFGSVLVTGGTITRTYTIRNTGPANLTLNGSPLISITGANAGDFTVTVDPVTPIAQNNSTTFQVRFDPGAEGLRTATISITNNDENEDPYDFMIQGTGLAPEMDVQGNGQSIPDDDATPSVDDHTDFGNLDILNDSLEYTFTITNTGGIDLNLTGTPIVQVTGTHASDFTVVQQPASNTVAAGGGTVTFVVRFNPSATGLRSAEITISNDDSDENPYNFSIQGTGTAVPEMDVLGNSISITDGDATPSVSDSTDFGSGDILTDIIVRTYTIANTGSAVLNLTGAPRVVIGGVNAGDFLVNRQPASGTVAAGGGTLTFQVTFNPTLTGLRQATVSISNDDSDENPYNFSIQGTGTAAPEITVYGNSTEITSGDLTPDPADHTDFGNTEISGPDITRRFKIYNVGSAAVNLTNPSPYVSIGGTHAADFSVTAIPVTPLTEYGDSTEFEITFNPSAEGVRTATLSIANNDGDENPYVFAIQGTGNPDPVPILVLSKIVDKGNASPGEELTYTINYENIGTGDATSITILEPVPSNTTFVQGSITAGGMTITYSHNNGASYDGSDAAPVTHIRFNRSGALPAGGSGSIIFRVTIN